MTELIPEFQTSLLRFLLQTKEGGRYLPKVEAALFDRPEDQIIWGLVQDYYKAHRLVPSKASLLQLASTNLTGESAQVLKMLRGRADELYLHFEEETGLIRRTILQHLQQQATRKLIVDFGPKIAKGDPEVYATIQRRMTEIVRMGETAHEIETKGGFLFKDFKTLGNSIKQGHPTFLTGLNRLTSAGGFYSPQLILLMGKPKAFKTGLLLNIAVAYARMGLKVYYADAENGKGALRARSVQALVNCRREDIVGDSIMVDGDPVPLKTYFGINSQLGGDLFFGFYPGRRYTMDDVDADLASLRDEHGWEPDLIVYDYLDLFASTEKGLKENRFRIQSVYHSAVALQEKWGAFGLTVTPVNRRAVEKDVLTEEDLGEDYAKAYNCHACFALCRTPQEQEAGIGRLVPVLQREGVAYTFDSTVYLRIDEARMLVQEITRAEAMDMLSAVKEQEAARSPRAPQKQPRAGRRNWREA